MNALFWVFGLAAATAVLPILFHLIQRTPQGRQVFSSLMFLRPVPPRFTKRSRINNWLLLLLRILALLLITAAFMRPFFNRGGELWNRPLPNRRVAIVMDTSASMQRESLWSQACATAEKLLNELESGDDFALYEFADQCRVRIDFDRDAQQTLAEKRSQALAQLRELKPGWGRTKTATALVHAIEGLESKQEGDQASSGGMPARLQIELISDGARSSDLEPLRQIEWPETVRLRWHALATKNQANATLQLLLPEEGESDLEPPRLRLRNYDGQQPLQVSASWSYLPLDSSATSPEEKSPGNDSAGSVDTADASVRPPAENVSRQTQEIEYQLPPAGQWSVALEVGKFESAEAYRLRGDQHPFDNEFFVAPRVAQTIEVWIVSELPLDNPDSAMYFLRQAMVDSALRRINAVRIEPGQLPRQFSAGEPSLVFVRDALLADDWQALQSYLKRGGIVQWCATAPAAMNQLRQNWPEVSDKAPENTTSGQTRQYSLLVDLDFRHPLLTLFGQPNYNDFTTIRFWRHLPIQVSASEQTQVLARFDDDQAAMWVHRIPRESTASSANPTAGGSMGRVNPAAGNLVVCNFGWHPDESQFALSSKFVIWVNQLIDWAIAAPPLARGLWVNDAVALSEWFPAATRVKRPDGTIVELLPNQVFDETREPGIYEALGPEGSWRFAVNLDREESESQAWELSDLEKLGVLLGDHPPQAQLLQIEKAKWERETEQEQKLWKWFLLAAVVVLILETGIAARTQVVAERTLQSLGTGA